MSVQTEPRPQRQEREIDPKYMTFVEHLQELRRRLIISFASIGVGSVVGWFLAPGAIKLIMAPVKKYLGSTIVVPTVYGGFTLQLKMAIIIGFVFALPITVYQIWAFIAPAFGPRANRYAPIWMISAVVLFLLGGITGYAVFPLAIKFFAQFQSNLGITILPFADQYLSFIILVLAVFGISFELPLALVTLSAAGITSSSWLWSKRAYAFFAVFIFSTIVTPGADPISPLILGGILFVLYLLAVLVSRLIGR
jgi:sec-independent protein translocase protein TatC